MQNENVFLYNRNNSLVDLEIIVYSRYTQILKYTKYTLVKTRINTTMARAKLHPFTTSLCGSKDLESIIISPPFFKRKSYSGKRRNDLRMEGNYAFTTCKIFPWIFSHWRY